MPRITFKGDGSWQELFNPEFTTDAWGVDHANWQWSGRVDQQKAFEDGLKDWQPLPGYTFMFYQGLSVNPHRSFPVATLQYVGLRDGTPPTVKGKDSQSLQSYAFSFVRNGQTIPATFNYLAARTTWTWCEKQQPGKTSRYKGVRRAINPLDSMQDFTAGGISRSDFMKIIRDNRAIFIPKATVTDYQVEDVVPGALWACTAEVEYRLQ